MPITALTCPICHRTVSLDHFAMTDCGLQIHPDYVSAVLADRQSQPTGVVRVTHGVGCPRADALIQMENVAINPLDVNAPLTGSAWHALMAQACASSEHVEVEVAGEIEGVHLVGHIDRIRRLNDGRLAIEDHKHGNDFARKYAELKPEHIVQLSIYAELYAQQLGERPTLGIIWRHFTGNPPFAVFKFDLWSAADCFGYKPLGGDYTVRELYRQMIGAIETQDWHALPLAGSSQSFGAKSACDYCAVRTVCMEAAFGAPF